MDRFLLCENPNKGYDRPLFVLQTIKHKMLIEVVPFESKEELNYNLDDVFDFYKYVNPNRITENYMFIIRDFFDLEESEIDSNIKEIRNHLNKAWKWYKSYLYKEDGIIDKEHGLGNPNLN